MKFAGKLIHGGQVYLCHTGTHYIYCDVPGSPCLSKKRIKCTVRFFLTDQRIPDPASCRCPEPRVGLLEIPSRWQATI